jgi:hypothetical protein
MAIHNIQTLIINTRATAINGIHTANTCHNDKAAFNKAGKIHASVGISHFHILNNEEYKAVNTQTYELSDSTSCNLLVFHHSPVHLLSTSFQ